MSDIKIKKIESVYEAMETGEKVTDMCAYKDSVILLTSKGRLFDIGHAGDLREIPLTWRKY